MDERKTPTYFEVVDLVDRVLPSKEEMDYTKITAEELLDRFNTEVKESGFYFEAGYLEGSRNIIRRYFASTYGRKSNYVGGRGDSFDQYNYYIQNQLSQARASLIKTLANPRHLVDASYNSASFHRDMGTTEELRPRLTSDRVENYVRTVLNVSWEKEGRMEIDSSALTADILVHFGLSDYGNLGYTKLGKKISSVLENFRANSLVAYGDLSRDGRYITKEEEYQKDLEYTIKVITDYVYDSLSKVYINTQKWEERRKKEEAEKSAPETTTIESTDTPVSERASDEPSQSTEEVSIEEMEDVISTYEDLQRRIAENIELAKELAELVKREKEIRDRIAENEEIIKRGMSK